jgi:hypothetical protein
MFVKKRNRTILKNNLQNFTNFLVKNVRSGVVLAEISRFDRIRIQKTGSQAEIHTHRGLTTNVIIIPTGGPVFMFISDINIEDFVAHRFYKRRGKARCRSKILEAHANVKDLNLIESKMNFIKVSFV